MRTARRPTAQRSLPAAATTTATTAAVTALVPAALPARHPDPPQPQHGGTHGAGEPSPGPDLRLVAAARNAIRCQLRRGHASGANGSPAAWLEALAERLARQTQVSVADTGAMAPRLARGLHVEAAHALEFAGLVYLGMGCAESAIRVLRRASAAYLKALDSNQPEYAERLADLAVGATALLAQAHGARFAETGDEGELAAARELTIAAARAYHTGAAPHPELELARALLAGTAGHRDRVMASLDCALAGLEARDDSADAVGDAVGDDGAEGGAVGELAADLLACDRSTLDYGRVFLAFADLDRAAGSPKSARLFYTVALAGFDLLNQAGFAARAHHGLAATYRALGAKRRAAEHEDRAIQLRDTL